MYEIWDFPIEAYYWKRLETNLFILDKQFKVTKTHTRYVLLTQNEPKHLLSNTWVESTCVALATRQKFGAVGSPEILRPRPSQNFGAVTAEILRSVPARSWHMETTVTRQQPTIMETTILICIHLPEYGIRQATTTLWTSYKIVTVDPQKFGITEIRRCRNSGVSDVKSANAACSESTIDTYVTKIESEILYIRNNLLVVFACHKIVWVSHGTRPNYSAVRLRLTAGSQCALFIQVERSKITRVTRLTTHCDVTVATQIVHCDVT